jgi:hypothetical protein
MSTRNALLASIEHWRRNAVGQFDGITGDNCALCEEFSHMVDCDGCPVAAAGHPGCITTPYYTAQRVYYKAVSSPVLINTTLDRMVIRVGEEFLAAAKAEHDFLVSLLPSVTEQGVADVFEPRSMHQWPGEGAVGLTPRQALLHSIEHWRRIATGYDKTLGAGACALCGLYQGRADKGLCEGCPVMANTGLPYCHGTPYRDAWICLRNGSFTGAKAMHDFLVGLLTTTME